MCVRPKKTYTPILFGCVYLCVVDFGVYFSTFASISFFSVSLMLLYKAHHTFYGSFFLFWFVRIIIGQFLYVLEQRALAFRFISSRSPAHTRTHIESNPFSIYALPKHLIVADTHSLNMHGTYFNRLVMYTYIYIWMGCSPMYLWATEWNEWTIECTCRYDSVFVTEAR